MPAGQLKLWREEAPLVCAHALTREHFTLSVVLSPSLSACTASVSRRCGGRFLNWTFCERSVNLRVRLEIILIRRACARELVCARVRVYQDDARERKSVIYNLLRPALLLFFGGGWYV